MKCTVSKEAVNAGLQRVLPVVPARSTIPVLSNLLFTAEEGRLCLSATDLDLSVRATVKADVKKAGASTLPARRVAGILRELPGPDVEMNSGERDSVEIRSASSFFRLHGISQEDFPPLPSFEGGSSFTVDARLIKTMLQRIGYAASNDETREVLNGALLSFRDQKLTVVATDGRRLALVEQELEFSKESETDLVLPSKTIAELIRALEDEGPARIHVTANQVAFETESLTMISKRIEGTYPNYRQVIPAQSESRIVMDREALFNAVRRVALLTNEQSNSVKLKFGKTELDISASTPDVGEASEQMAIKNTGPELSASFNPEYLLDPLKNLVCDEVYLELTDDVSPGVLKTEEPFLYVLMPMRMS